MSRSWVDVVARVRGLSARLIARHRLVELAQSHDLVQLGVGLEEAYGAASGISATATAEGLELAVRRMAAKLWRVAARWSDERSAAVLPFLLDEDRRSIRAVARGATANATARERLAALIPTPLLPERALEELARQASVSAIVSLLSAWQHPFAPELHDVARAAKVDLLRFDIHLNRAYVASALAAALRAPLSGRIRRDLIAFVRETIDIDNISTALQLAANTSSIDPVELFVAGGRSLSRDRFLEATRARDAIAARTLLGDALRGGPLAGVFSQPRFSLEDATLRAALVRALRGSRLAPLGVVPVIAFALRLRAQARDLRLIIWRVASGAPPVNADALVSAR